jgi:hypothetical protein
MMPYPSCQQHGCWVIQFVYARKMRLPKFFFGQRVFAEYLNEEETDIERHYGRVIGLVYKPPGLSTRVYTPGWHCLVRWDDDRVTRSRLLYVEIHEVELVAVEQVAEDDLGDDFWDEGENRS